MKYFKGMTMVLFGCLVFCGAVAQAEENDVPKTASSQMASTEQTASTTPQNSNEGLTELWAHITNKRWEEADALCRMLLKEASDPKMRVNLNRQLAVIAKQRNALDAFLAEATSAVAANPSDYDAHWRLIEGAMTNGQPKESLAAAERAAKQFPEDKELKVRLLMAYVSVGQADKAIEGLKAEAAKEPNILSTFQLAQAYASAGRFNDAETTLKSAEQSDSANIPAYEQQLAEIYVQSGQASKAIAIYESLLVKVSEPGRQTFFKNRITQLKQETPTPSAPSSEASKTKTPGQA